MKYSIEKEKFYITPRLAVLIQRYSRGKSLDAGCGTGEYFKYFKGEELYGIDVTPTYLKKIKKPKNKKIFLKKADVRKIPSLNEYFDFVFSAAVLEYMSNEKEIKKAVNEMKRVLKKGGFLIVSVPHNNSFTSFVRKQLIGRLLVQKAEDPYFVMGNSFSSEDLEKLGFKTKGCLGWVTWKNLNNDLLAKITDNIFWKFPFLSGTLIGIYEKK